VFNFEVNDLVVRYAGAHVSAVDGVTLAIGPGEIVGLSGPSGCGKSTIASALMGLLPSDASVSGSITLRGRNLRQCSERELSTLRGTSVGIIYQESALALNPLMTVGAQIAEVVRAHERCDRATARSRAVNAMREVALDVDDGRIYDSYPHELSGGQRQRILIAQAIVCRPAFVVADEPTASLDASVRSEILDLIRTLSVHHRMAFLLISHSAAVLASTAHRVIEMRDGQIRNGVGSDGAASHGPGSHFAGVDGNDSRPHDSRPLIEIAGARKAHSQRRFVGARHRVEVLRGVDLRLAHGQTLGLTGLSGCGKSTLARCIAGIDTLDAGEIRLAGRVVSALSGSERQQYRNQVQLIFQDSAAAFNPRFSIYDVISEPMRVQHIGTPEERRARAIELIGKVGLPSDRLNARPGELSGGERQRVAIARALAVRPRVLLLDEAFSGLDTETRARITNLLRELQARDGLAYLCISHDIDLLSEFASEIVVMRDGRIVESEPDRTVVPVVVPA
jgi:peptide/nickel transport system ATP-binding protein